MIQTIGTPKPWTDLNPTRRQLGLRCIRYDVTRRFDELSDFYPLFLYS